MELFSLSVKLGLDTSGFESGTQKAQTQTKRLADVLSRELSTSSQNAEKSTRSLSDSTAGLAQTFEKAFTRSQLLANSIMTVAGKLASLGQSAISDGVKFNAQMEKYTVAFGNMLGSATEASNVLQQIKEDAARTPLNVESLVQANQLLISAGVDAGEARKTILALGDAVSATGGGNDALSRMAQNLQQVKNVGKAASIDIKQFAYAAGKVTTTTTQTCDKVVLSVSEMQSRIDKNLSEAKTKWQNGIMGTLQSVFTDLKNGNWTSLATTFASLVWGEVTQKQREIISDWCNDAMDVINESYSGGGMKKMVETLQQLLTKGFASGEGGSKTTIDSLSNLLLGTGGKTSQLLEVKSNVDSITLSVDAFKTSLESINAGGIMSNLSGIAGGFGGITQALSGIVGFIIANPVVAAILGLTALVGGAAVASWSKNKSERVTNNYESPYGTTPVYDSLAEFSARAEQLNRYSSVTASPFAGSQQDTTGKQQLSVLQRISNSLDEHLPAIGTGTLVIDANGVQALAGAMRPTLTNGIDGDLGIRAARKARGG